MNEKLQRILYAEDDPGLQAIALVSLTQIGGFTVRICDSGAQLVDEFEGFKPDLILLDVMMPEIDGPQTLELLRQKHETRDVPILFITAKSQTSELNQLKSLGAIGVLSKPFDPMTLPDQIREHWSQYFNDSK